jgi:hypothetical protein
VENTKRLSQDNWVSRPRFELSISRKQVLSITATLTRSVHVTYGEVEQRCRIILC